MSVATEVCRKPALGALAIDRASQHASVAGSELYLSEGEFMLLAALADEPSLTLSYEELLAGPFADVPGASVDTIDAYGRRLSRKLELRDFGGRLSREDGFGFQLEPAHAEAVNQGATR